ncbi:hypothetical protein ONZ45_g6808 [Pleurotus djamor]|nr:hypothetical protein ONZ45_g6808 [Pleurotus djamor]
MLPIQPIKKPKSELSFNPHIRLLPQESAEIHPTAAATNRLRLSVGTSKLSLKPSPFFAMAEPSLKHGLERSASYT